MLRRLYKFFSVLAVLAVVTGHVAAQEVSDIDRFNLFNECGPMRLVIESLPANAAAIGLTEARIHTLAESRLRAARLYDHSSRAARLYIRVSVLNYDNASVSKADGSQSLVPLGLATAGPLVGTGLTGRKAARTLESLCFAGSAPGPRCSLSYARLWRAWGRASSKHQPTPTPVRTRPRMSSTTRRHTESKVPGRPPSRPSRSVWSANGLARGGHPLSASLTMRLTSPQYG